VESIQDFAFASKKHEARIVYTFASCHTISHLSVSVAQSKQKDDENKTK